MPLKYRPDIDGLRAIAVLSVILFHNDVPGFPGGFVGVDIFFVISGFLITSIILKDIKQEQFSVARFYERRIRRIFPALFPVIAFTLIVGAYLFDASTFSDFGKSIAATTLFSSNILFWRESGYFDAPSLQKPLLHTWSLAVEEQFYIFFPLALVFIHKYQKSRYLLWIGIALAISLGSSIYGVFNFQSATFYLVPQRAWELLAGAVLALGVLPIPSKKWLRNLVSVTGLAFIIYSIGAYTEATLFPGYNAIAPVLGACLIIYSHRSDWTPTIVSKILSLRPLVFIGLISYSLYLWHWPLVAFTKYLMFRPLNGYEKTGLILAAFAVSVLSWKFIEQPFRKTQPFLPEKKQLFTVAATVMIIFTAIGGVIYLQNGMAWRYPEANREIMDIKNDPQWAYFDEYETWLHGIKNGNIPRVIGRKDVIPSFVLWGDSHANALVTALKEKGNEYGVSGYQITHGHCLRPLLGMCGMYGENYGIDEAAQNQSVIDFIRKHPEIKFVILAGAWGQQPQMKDVTGEYKNSESFSVLLRAGLFRTVKSLQDLGKKIVLVYDVPTLTEEPDRALYIAKRFGSDIVVNNLGQTSEEYESLNQDAITVISEISQQYKIQIIKPEMLFYKKNKNKSIVLNDGKMLYIDTGHLSTYGSHYVAPAFDELFQRISKDKISIANKLHFTP